MLVVLSQKVDTASAYTDELFRTYHYPSRYRNQLHEGDIFVYYQGNRFDRTQRYYFGTGVVTHISTDDEENYYATLDDCKRFSKKVPIYLPDGGYIEQLCYQEIRKSINPPWQSSVRPLSKHAYNYILQHAGSVEDITLPSSVESLKEDLKRSIRDFFIEKDTAAVLQISQTAMALSKELKLSDGRARNVGSSLEELRPLQPSPNIVDELLSYLKGMKMTYSYKPILVMALIELHDENWTVSADAAAHYFEKFYQQRRKIGLPVERKKCIYQNPNVTLNQIIANLISNPIKALVESGFFEYSSDAGLFSLCTDLKSNLSEKDLVGIRDICKAKLERYYSR